VNSTVQKTVAVCNVGKLLWAHYAESYCSSYLYFLSYCFDRNSRNFKQCESYITAF
jgi:hypothetical protein